MRVFMTGATGYIGGAVAEALSARGHGVVALARTEEAARALTARGYRTVLGDLRETARLERAARAADAVVHAAMEPGDDAAVVDRAVAEAILRALEGTDRPFVYTSGIWVLGPTGDAAADETARRDPAALVAWRSAVEDLVLAGAARGVRAVVVRPAIVYGRGAGIPALVARGDLPVVGDGRQRWPLVHVDDLAALYAKALESAPAGTLLHGASGEMSMGDLARIGRGGPIERRTLEEARSTLGAFADALALDQRVSARRARELLGWTPEEPSLVEELLAGSYAERPTATR